VPNPAQTLIAKSHAVPRLKGRFLFSQWSFDSSESPKRNGHIACCGLAVQLCAYAHINNGWCDKPMKTLFQRGVDVWAAALKGGADDYLFVDDVMKFASLPISVQLHGTMLGSDFYSANGFVVEPSASLARVLLDNTVGFSSYFAVTDMNKHTQIVSTFKTKPLASFMWNDSHPCTVAGVPTSHEDGFAWWCFHPDEKHMDSWIQETRYGRKPVQFTAFRIVAAMNDEIVANLQSRCGSCGLCFATPNVVN
jgi:hypothetical protein